MMNFHQAGYSIGWSRLVIAMILLIVFGFAAGPARADQAPFPSLAGFAPPGVVLFLEGDLSEPELLDGWFGSQLEAALKLRSDNLQETIRRVYGFPIDQGPAAEDTRAFSLFIINWNLQQLVPRAIEQGRAAKQYAACKESLRNLGMSLEMYSTDFEGRYPCDLTAVTPEDGRETPTCPAGGSYHYQYAQDPSAYTVSCRGRAHRVVGISDGFPTYNSHQGLEAPPASMQRLQDDIRIDACVVYRMNHPPAAEKALRSMVDGYQTIKNLPYGVHYSADSYREWELRLPDRTGYPFLARQDRYLILAGNREALVLAIRTFRTELPSLATAAEYERFRSGVPGDACFVAFMSLKKVYAGLFEILKASGGEEPGPDRTLAQLADSFAAMQAVGSWISMDEKHLKLEGRLLVDPAGPARLLRRAFSSQGLDVRSNLDQLPQGAALAMATDLEAIIKAATDQFKGLTEADLEPTGTGAETDQEPITPIPGKAEVILKVLEVLTGELELGVSDFDFLPELISQMEALEHLKTCQNNLSIFSDAIFRYHGDDNEALPPSLDALLRKPASSSEGEPAALLDRMPTCPAGGWYDYRRSVDGRSYTICCVQDAHADIGVMGRNPGYDSAIGLKFDSPGIDDLTAFKKIRAFLVIGIDGREAMMNALGPAALLILAEGTQTYKGVMMVKLPDEIPLRLAFTDRAIIVGPAAAGVLEGIIDQQGQNQGYTRDRSFQDFASGLEGRWVFYAASDVGAFRPLLEKAQEKLRQAGLDEILPPGGGPEPEALAGPSRTEIKAALESLMDFLMVIDSVRSAIAVDEDGGRLRMEITRE